MSSVWRHVELRGEGQGREFRFKTLKTKWLWNIFLSLVLWKKKEKKKATLIDELDKEYVNEFNYVNLSLLIDSSLLFQTKLGSSITEGCGWSIDQIKLFKSLHLLFTKNYINDTQ